MRSHHFKGGLEHTNSYYAASLDQTVQYPRLTESINCDVCIIGGGYTVLSTALNLAENGYRTVVLGSNRVGWGASGRNGGQLGSGMNNSQSELEKEFGIERAKLFWSLCQEAKGEVLHRIRLHQVDCDYKSGVVGAAMTWKVD